MNNTDSEQTQYDDDDDDYAAFKAHFALRYKNYNPEAEDDDVLGHRREMAFRYKNYNPETDAFTINDDSENVRDLYFEGGWEHYNNKEIYERDHTEKEKWILEEAIKTVKKNKGYPEHTKNWGEVNKSKYEEYDFDAAELWIDYKEERVYIRLYCPKTNFDHVEYLNLGDLEEYDNNSQIQTQEKFDEFFYKERDDIDAWFDYDTEEIIWNFKKKINAYFNSVKNEVLHMRLDDLKEEEELIKLKQNKVKKKMRKVLEDLIDDLKEDLEEKMKNLKKF